MTLQVEARTSLAGLEQQWDALVDSAPIPSPFLRAWWLDRVAGPNPRFVVVLDEHDLLGGVALEEVVVLGVPRFRHVGFRLGADHLDLVAQPGHVEPVVDAVRAWLARRDVIVDLIGMAAPARIQGALEGWGACEVIEHAPWTKLADTLDDYLEHRPPELRALIERPWRRLERAGVQHRIAGPDDCALALEAMRQLHAEQWGTRSHFLPHFAVFARAARTGVARRELVIHQLVAGDEVIAVTAFFEVAGRASFCQSARDGRRSWRGAGTALMARAIEHACASGCRELDLLRGTEPYKARWADSSRAVLRCRGVRGARAQVASACISLAWRGRHVARTISRRGP